MINSEIGERLIKFGNLELGCRPDFRALVAIEDLTNKSAPRILKEFVLEQVKITDAVKIIYACHTSYNPNTKVTFDELMKSAVDSGKSVDAVLPAIEMLSYVLAGGKKKATKKD